MVVYTVWLWLSSCSKRSKTGGGNQNEANVPSFSFWDRIRCSLGTRQNAYRVSATPPSQIHLPEWMALVLDEDKQGGKLSSSNMLGQLAKRYQDKPSSLSWIHGLSYWTEWGHSLTGQTHTSSFNHLSSSRTSSSLKCMSFHFILSCWIESQLVPFFSVYVARHGIGLSITLY